MATTLGPIVDAIENQLVALQAQIGLLRAVAALQMEVDAGRAACKHPTIIRTTAHEREDEYFCGDCGVQLAQMKDAAPPA